MFKLYNFLSIIICFFISVNTVYANKCSTYKIKPKIVIHIPEYNINVVQPRAEMELLHGSVVATLINDYEINTDITPTDGGVCVSLKSVDATIGYNDFLVKIDRRHTKNTCSYNAILNHENMHINAYLSVIEEYKVDLHNSLYAAAATVMPIFVENISGVDSAIEKLNNELQSNPDIILLMQKIHAAEEINNKKIDRFEDYSDIKKCLE